MIFVTVGMHTQSFHRLIQAMDEYAATAGEQVVMQIGHSTYIPLHCEWFQFASYQDMQRWSQEARVVVSHGATSILTALQQGTPVVAVPRERRFNEHIDNHQVEFVEALARAGWISSARDVEELDSILCSPLARPEMPGIPSLANNLREFVTILR